MALPLQTLQQPSSLLETGSGTMHSSSSRKSLASVGGVMVEAWRMVMAAVAVEWGGEAGVQAMDLLVPSQWPVWLRAWLMPSNGGSNTCGNCSSSGSRRR